jgi:hypothetical protein
VPSWPLKDAPLSEFRQKLVRVARTDAHIGAYRDCLIAGEYAAAAGYLQQLLQEA